MLNNGEPEDPYRYLLMVLTHEARGKIAQLRAMGERLQARQKISPAQQLTYGKEVAHHAKALDQLFDCVYLYVEDNNLRSARFLDEILEPALSRLGSRLSKQILIEKVVKASTVAVRPGYAIHSLSLLMHDPQVEKVVVVDRPHSMTIDANVFFKDGGLSALNQDQIQALLHRADVDSDLRAGERTICVRFPRETK